MGISSQAQKKVANVRQETRFQYFGNPHIPTLQVEKLQSRREGLLAHYNERSTEVMMDGLFIVISSTLKLLYYTVVVIPLPLISY